MLAGQLASQLGRRVLVGRPAQPYRGERVDHHDDAGILEHGYGPHIFSKQWDLDPSELDASLAAPIPTRTNRDGRYFTDTFQAMPKHGYTRMFERMLEHPNVTPRPENGELYKHYRALADERNDVVFVGRLATYRYYNMARSSPRRSPRSSGCATARGRRPRMIATSPPGGPPHTQLLDPRFHEQLAAHARGATERLPWVEDWTPVNEPLTTARPPPCTNTGTRTHDRSFARALLAHCHAGVLAMEQVACLQSRRQPRVRMRVHACLRKVLSAAVHCNQRLSDLQRFSMSRSSLHLVGPDL